jgi:hypothetical protein
MVGDATEKPFHERSSLSQARGRAGRDVPIAAGVAGRSLDLDAHAAARSLEDRGDVKTARQPHVRDPGIVFRSNKYAPSLSRSTTINPIPWRAGMVILADHSLLPFLAMYSVAPTVISISAVFSALFCADVEYVCMEMFGNGFYGVALANLRQSRRSYAVVMTCIYVFYKERFGTPASAQYSFNTFFVSWETCQQTSDLIEGYRYDSDGD